MSLVDLGKRLLDAAKRGDTDEVRTLMSNGAPFTTDWLGTSPLHFAAQCGHQATAEVLLRAGISRDARTKVDRTPLHVAAQEGNVTIVDLLLAHSADIEAKDMLKMTPLHWATEKGNQAVLESLIKHGADVTCENKFDRTPLDIALRNGRPDLVPLLQGGADTTIAVAETEPETITIETSETTITTDLEEQVTADAETVITTTIDGTVIHPESTDDSNIIPVQMFSNSNMKVSVEGSDQNSTSVLATLAAIAEATAPNTTQSSNNNEVMNWLESQGITMISTSDGNIISSAVESGQTISLTEAGKIALNIIQQQGETEETEPAFETSQTTGIEELATDNQQKVITIVTEQSGEEISSEETPLLVTVGEDGTVIESTEVPQVDDQDNEPLEPPLKRIKLEPGTEITDSNVLDISQLLEKSTEEGVDREELRKQLEVVQKQAEEYKLQLHQKEQEAAVYKHQLSQITSKTS